MAEMVLELVLELRPQEREWSPRDEREMISHDRNASAPAKIPQPQPNPVTGWVDEYSSITTSRIPPLTVKQ